MFYTYAHYKPNGDLFYIGKGSHSRAYSRKGRNTHWNNVVKKYGDYKVQILANWTTEQEAFDHEILLIECFTDMGFVLSNISKGGLGSSGFKHSQQFKDIQKQRFLINNPMYSPAARKNHIEKVKEAMQRPEVKKKQSANRIGMVFSEEHKKNLSKAHKGKFARKDSVSAKKVKFNNMIFDCIMDLADYAGIKHKTMYTRIYRNAAKYGYEVLK